MVCKCCCTNPTYDCSSSPQVTHERNEDTCALSLDSARLPKTGDNNGIFFPPFFSRRKYRKFPIDNIRFFNFFVPFLFLNLSLDFENQGKHAGNVTKHAANSTYFELCFFCLAQIKIPWNKILLNFQSKL